MKKIILFVSLISMKAFCAEGLTIIAVGDATLEKEKIVFERHSVNWGKYTSKQKRMSQSLFKLFSNDFSFYKKLFEIEVLSANNPKIGNAPRYDYWKGKNASFLVRVEISFDKKNDLIYSFKAYDINKSREIISTDGRTSRDVMRRDGHRLSDMLYKKITERESIFKTKITFVSDKASSRKKRIKELYIMDFDGFNLRRLTYHKGTVISPAISHDGKYILYSLIQNKVRKNRNVNLYMYSLVDHKISLLSNRRGVNSGAVFMPDGENILLTLSHVGNAEIFVMNLKTRKLRRITRHYAVDVDPSISVDGNLMAFLSGRAGKAMIYTLNPNGEEQSVNRVSYVGQYNATPRFSPDGKEIVFSSWLDNGFDLFRISSDGTGLSRLTKKFGSNEDPTYSKDGQFIAFSSKRVISRRKAVENIYIMDRDGEILGNLTHNYGNCITPRWSK